MKRDLKWYSGLMKIRNQDHELGFYVMPEEPGRSYDFSSTELLEDPLFAISTDKQMQLILKNILNSPNKKNWGGNIPHETGVPHPYARLCLEYLTMFEVLHYNMVPTKHHSPEVGTMMVEWFSVSPDYEKKLKSLLMKQQKTKK